MGRLATSGSLSWREQTRAAATMRQQVTTLTNEMGQLTKVQKAATGGRAMLGAVAGVTATGYVLKSAVDKVMSYDLHMAYMANTAYADLDFAGRKACQRQAGGNSRNGKNRTLSQRSPMSTEAQIAADIDAIKAAHPDTQDLYREVCALLFFRYGITPTGSKLYQYVRKGSMSAPAEALARFWKDLREKAVSV